MSWLSKLGGKAQRRRSSGVKKLNEKEEKESSRAFTEVSASTVKKNMDENQYVFAYPELVNGMSDHILSHRRGKEFSYATLVEGVPESRDTLLSRLRSFRPESGKVTTTADKMPHINLTGPYHCLKLSQATKFLSTKKIPFNYSKEYILVSEILLTYVPLISFGDKFSAFKVALIDNRKIDDTIVRSYTGNTNISCNASMSLDYCTSLADVDDMEIAFVCPQPTLKPGKVWAVVNVHLVLQQLDFPAQTYVKPTFSIFQIPHSGLEDHDVDPRHFNGLIQEADLEAMKQIKSDGDITDISKPHVKTMAKSALAGTAFAGKPAMKPTLGAPFQPAKAESVESGYLPSEEGNESEVPIAIQRLQASALKDQRKMMGLNENEVPREEEEIVKNLKKTFPERTFSGSTYDEMTNVSDEILVEDPEITVEKQKKKVMFASVKSSIGETMNKGDEGLAYYE